MFTFLTTLLADCAPGIGCITPPDSVGNPVIGPDGKLTGITAFMNLMLQAIFLVAGLWAFFNFIFAGFQFINAGGDPKSLAAAWQRIWQSVLGLFIIIASFLFAAILGLLLFGDPMAILNPTIKK